MSVRIWISREVKNQYDAYIRYAPGEVSGLGEVERLGDGGLLITKLYLFPQTATSSETTLDDDELHKFLYEAVVSGADTSKLKLWWHSHADMGVFWSGQDESTIKKFSDNDFMLFVVGNKKGEYLARVDMWQPFRISLDKCPFAILPEPQDEAVMAAFKAEVAEKVKPPAYTATTIRTYTPSTFGTEKNTTYPNPYLGGDWEEYGDRYGGWRDYWRGD